MPHVVRAWFLVVCVAIAAVGAFFVVMGAQERDKAVEAMSWPTVEGTITESRVATSGSRKHRTTSHILRYEYSVDGVPHEGSRRSFLVDVEGASVHAAEYTVGQAVLVHHDPARPGEACLEASAPGWEAWPPITMGLFAMLFSTGIAWLAWVISGLMIHPERDPAPLLRLLFGAKRLDRVLAAARRARPSPTEHGPTP